MTRPDDISQEDWDAGLQWQKWFYDDMDREVQEAVARAIMAERTKCANQVFHVAKHVKATK